MDAVVSPLARQEQLLPFLLNPRSYPHQPRAVRLVQTHASFVFIAPPFVYKVKKPVNFGFLNFSTLEKRRHFCEREVALNRRLSPSIYLGVVPISTRNGRFVFGAALLCNWTFDAAWGAGYYSAHHWTIGVALLIAAAPSWVFGNQLRKHAARTVIEKATGQEMLLDEARHRLFFIPMHYWGGILLSIGVVMFVMEFVK